MSRRPVDQPYTITTEFGEPDPNALFLYHSGVDYAKPTGSEVKAPIAGIVRYAQMHPIRGNMVGIFDGTYTHRLMHNSSFNVSVGQHVNEGDVVAWSGATGLATGPHVHWDILKGDKMDATAFSDFIDPFIWLNSGVAPAPTPAPVTDVLQPFQRRVKSDGVNYRKGPSVNTEIIKEFPPNDVLDFKGYVHGEPYAGNDIWFVGKYTGGYCWSGSFTDPGVNGLPDMTTPLNPPAIPPVSPSPTPVEPTPIPPVIAPDYAFQKDLDCVTEVVPAGLGSFEYGNFPARPEKVVIHDFGTRGKDTIESVVNYFKQKDNISAHFVVSGKRIIQMVALHDRAYHAGPNGNGFVGIETDPTQDPDTIASVRTVLKQLKARYGYQFPLIEHNQIQPTLCGDDVDLADYDITPVAPIEPVEVDMERVVNFLKKTFKDFK